MRFASLIAGAVLLCGSMALAESAPRSIPYVKDIKVDGPISQWKAVASIGNWNGKDSIVYGSDNWTGPADLGGTGWMGWDEHNLYIAADVIDDQVRQSGSGSDIWRGDHVMVLLNVHPERKTAPGPFKEAGQFQLGLSPGSLGGAGADLLSSLPPEAYVWKPQNAGNSGISLSAKKTDKGYEIQGAIPWSFLGVRPHNGLKINFDLCPSDCDTTDMQQQTLASLVPGTWSVSTARLLSAVLEGGSAQATAAAGPKIELSRPEIKLKVKQSRDFAFNAPAAQDGLVPVLSLKARGDYPKLAGATYGFVVEVNGKKLGPDRCINRPPSVMFADGQSLNLYTSNAWTLIYGPNYTSVHTDIYSSYYIQPGVFDAYLFRFNLDGLLKPGQNVVTVRNDASDPKAVMAIEDVLVQPLPADEAKKRMLQPQVLPAVTVRPPKELTPPAQAVLSDGGALHFQAAGKTWTIDSQFSEPNGKWVKLGNQRDGGWTKFDRSSPTHLSASTAQFSLDRQIQPNGECLEIHETLTNLTDQKLPIMVRHQLPLPLSQVDALTLNGRPMPLKRGITSNPENPTLLLKTTQGGGLGLVPYDGVFRLHHQAFYLNNTAGLADGSLVLAPHAVYEQIWQVYAVPTGDYWDFANAIRRQWDTNFKIEGPFVFVYPDSSSPKMQGGYDVQQMKQWLSRRCAALPAINGSNDVCHSLLYKLPEQYVQQVRHVADIIHQADPALPVLHYFHCFLTGVPYNKEADPADALVDPSGQPVFYGNDPHWPIFVPTTTNAYGRLMMRQAKDLIQKLNLNGLYWDEQQYSFRMYDYGKDWDGVSGDIDPNTHKLLGIKSLVPLISGKFRHELMQWLLKNKYTVVCNGQPMTPEWAQYKVHRFVETGSITNLYDANLFSPVGLGDYLTERTGADTVRSQIRFLDYGSLYDYYESTIDVENPGLCRWMYPTTPIALGHGYILAKERILTNRSGRFSWGDKTLPPIEVHEIDATGNEVVPDWKKVTVDGIEWVELHLPPNHAAAIVRK